MRGTLYLVATPIGNLGDMSFRAVEILRQVDLVACEDTRHSRKLLNHFDIPAKTISYHEHNEIERAVELIEQLKQGRCIAVLSDAGTPAISDPGYRLVGSAIENNITVIPVPGAVAFVTAAIASGLPTDSIYYGGFLPSRSAERRRRLDEVKDIPATLVFYEAPHRLAKTLGDCLDILGPRTAVVARELTKLHEEFVRGDLADLAHRFSREQVKGECVLMIDRGIGDMPATETSLTLSQRILALERAGADRKTALKQAAREFGLTRSEAYRRLQSEKGFVIARSGVR